MKQIAKRKVTLAAASVLETLLFYRMTPQVTEETGDETKVEVDLGQAARESPKPSHVTSVEETHEVITTREDVVEFTEEESKGEQVEVGVAAT